MTDQPHPPEPRDDAIEAERPAAQNATVAYSPPPEPRPEWTRSAWLDPAEPVPAPAAPTESVTPSAPTVTGSRRNGPDGLGRILGAALLSAVLASGGTVLVLDGTGALNRPAGSGSGSGNVAAGQTPNPVVIDDSSAVVSAAASVIPAVVRITATGTTT